MDIKQLSSKERFMLTAANAMLVCGLVGMCLVVVLKP